ncbi:MAG: dTDP-4-dehydrorhamnose reductase [Patescibacteria group bacterium]|nr:dTDP-4-dehydrorhamnose reductase [Patescibacteria group bacterium]
MKILILGAKGNLGAQLAAVFAEANEAEVISWDKEDIDIADGESLIEKIIGLEPQFIINAAAYNAVDKCEADDNEFALAKKINGEAVGFLTQAAAKINATIVHYSTDYVFDGVNRDGYDEAALPAPINNYGISKLLGEEELMTSSDGPRHYLIRTSKLFGPQGPSVSAKPSFFDLMLKAAEKNDRVKAVDEEKSCFTYTPDLAKATKKLLEEKKPFGIYHIINSNPATWYEACLELFKIAGVEKKVMPVTGNEFPRPARRPAQSVLLNTKLPPLRSYQEALKEYIKKIVS